MIELEKAAPVHKLEFVFEIEMVGVTTVKLTETVFEVEVHPNAFVANTEYDELTFGDTPVGF